MSFVSQDISVKSNAPSADSAIVADLDGDERPDVLYATRESTVWHSNTDGRGTFTSEQFLIDDVGSTSLYAADVDGDNDTDVFSVPWVTDGRRWFTGGIVWYENTDGKGSFGEQQFITDAIVYGSISAADMDGDGDVDLVTVAEGIGGVWYENTDGFGVFGIPKMIEAEASVVVPADIDGDGDTDALVGIGMNRFDRISIIAWKENVDGEGTFGELQTIAEARAWSITVADIDNDGDADILTASLYFSQGELIWYENADEAFRKRTVSTTPATAATVSDIDGDGDLDIISSSIDLSGRSNVLWYENTDGKGTFVTEQVIDTGNRSSLFAADLDQDSTLR